MSEISQKVAEMLNMLPIDEQELAYELVKRILSAWDRDFTKLTPEEEAAISEVEAEYARGEAIPDSAIDWDADNFIVDTNLTDEDKAIIQKGRKAYSSGEYVPLTDIVHKQNF